VGKSYRIARGDLEALAGAPMPSAAPADAAWVTSIVDVPDVGPNVARKIAGAVPAALNSREARQTAIRADVVYEPERSHLKVIIGGSPGDSAYLLKLIAVWLEQFTP
jgi:hypothetical protein